MSKKFFFGVVVGFFVAVVAFVVFLFFSGTVRAAVVEDSQQVAVYDVSVVDDGGKLAGVNVRDGVVPKDLVVVDSVVAGQV